MNFAFLDIFGTSIGLRYLSKENYQTSFGSIITVIIGVCITIQTVLVGIELFAKENPEVIFSERFVASPERFYLKNDTFNFAFGAQFPGNYSQFMDETIYTVSAQQLYMTKVLNKQTNEYDQKWVTTPIDVKPCKITQFGVEETIQYFQKLPGFEQMYCLDQETNPLFIEGNFDQESYSVVQITMKLCTGSLSCRDTTEIKKILTNSFVAFYQNDVIVNPKNINPFTTVGRDFYWNASPTFAKDIYMYFRNIYVESDKGILFEEKSYDRATASSVQSEQIIFDESDYYFQFFLRFEKAKESVFHRSYKKLDSALAQIGGIAKALLMIGFFVSIPINRLKFSQQLSNQLFNYRSDSQVEKRLSNAKLPNPINNFPNKEFSGQNNSNNLKIEISNNINNNQSQFLDQNNHETSRKLISPLSPLSQNNINSQVDQFDFQINSDNHLNEKELAKKGKQLNRSKKNPVSDSNIELAKGKNEYKFAAASQFAQQKQLSLQGNQFSAKLLQSGQLDDSNRLNVESVNRLCYENTNNSQKFGKNFAKILSIQQQLKASISGGLKQQSPILPVDTKIQESQLKYQININPVSNPITLEKDISQDQQINELPRAQQSQFKENTLELKWTDYVRYYFWPFGDFKKKKEIIEYSTKKMYQHLDIVYIVNKLLELEKLKQLLLDDDQISIIQFLPKPYINVDEITGEAYKINNKEEFQSHKQITLLNDVVKIDEKSKAQAAYKAMRNILKKKKLSQIDKKIIELIESQTLDNMASNIDQLVEIEEKDNDDAVTSDKNNNNNNELALQNNVFEEKFQDQKEIHANMILSSQDNSVISEDLEVGNEKENEKKKSAEIHNISNNIPIFQIQEKSINLPKE